MMTLKEIRCLEREFLTPAEVAPIIGSDPQSIRVTAVQRPDLLGFPVCRIGSRTKIPRRAFLAWIEGGNQR